MRYWFLFLEANDKFSYCLGFLTIIMAKNRKATYEKKFPLYLCSSTAAEIIPPPISKQIKTIPRGIELKNIKSCGNYCSSRNIEMV